MGKNKLILISVSLLIVSALFIFLRVSNSTILPFNWDEVDYVHAANNGIINNAMGNGSLSLYAFLKLGYSKIKRSTPLNSRLSLQNYREKEDPFILRHFHPPLSVYLWSAVEQFIPIKKELSLRYFMGLLGLAVLLLLAYIAAKDSVNDLMGLSIVAPILVTSASFLDTFTSLQFHGLLSLTAVFFIFAAGLFLSKPRYSTALTIGFSLTLLVLSQENFVFILVGPIALLIYLRFFKKDRTLLINKKLLVIVSFTFIVTLILMWPAVLWTGGPIKSWLMYAYRIFMMRNKEYSQSGLRFIEVYKGDFSYIVLLIVGIVFNLKNIEKLKRHGNSEMQWIMLLALWSGTGFLIFMAPFILSPTYIMPGLVILIIPASYGIGEIIKKYKMTVTLLLLIIVIPFVFYNMHNLPSRNSLKKQADGFYKDIHYLRYNLPHGPKTCFVDGAHIYRYYLPQQDKFNLVNIFYGSEEHPFQIRKNMINIDVDNKIRGSKIAAIVLQKKHRYWSSSKNVQSILDSRYALNYSGSTIDVYLPQSKK